MPAPTPIIQLATMSNRISLAKIHATPLAKNMASPIASIFKDSPPRSESQPASNTKGIISNEGNDVSICISSCEADGNTRLKSSRIGETANPGNEVTADTDQIANSASRDIVPFPVEIFIATRLYKPCRYEYNVSANYYLLSPNSSLLFYASHLQAICTAGWMV